LPDGLKVVIALYIMLLLPNAKGSQPVQVIVMEKTPLSKGMVRCTGMGLCPGR